MIPLSLLGRWREGLIAALLLACALLYSDLRVTESEFTAYRADVEAKGAKQEAKVAVIEAQQDVITERSNADFKDHRRDVHDFYRRRVLPSGSNSKPMPGISRAPERIDEVPSDALPLAEQCAETTFQLIDLQKWIGEVRAVPK